MSVQTASYIEAIEHLPKGATLRIPAVRWEDYEQLLARFGDGVQQPIADAPQPPDIIARQQQIGRPLRLEISRDGAGTGIAAALSYSVLGAITQYFGDVVGFSVMAASAASAAILLWALLPETKPAEYED